MNNLTYTLIKLSFEFLFKGVVVNNASCGSSFIKGGIAREWAMYHFGLLHKEDIIYRDCDLLLDEDDYTSSCAQLVHRNLADYDTFFREGVEETLIANLLSDVDVSINSVLLGKEGLYVANSAIEDLLNRRVTVIDKRKEAKCSIRAHFFALRYNLRCDEVLPLEHHYYETTAFKGFQLGILQEWDEWLEDRGVCIDRLREKAVEHLINPERLLEKRELKYEMWDWILSFMEVEDYPRLGLMTEWCKDALLYEESERIVVFHYPSGEMMEILDGSSSIYNILSGETVTLREY